MLLRISACTIALTFGLAGCAGDSEQAVVHPAEDVIDGDIDVRPAPDGTSATVHVTTSIDMVCAVVYGTTPELGDGIATDADMGGGAHTEHEAVLTGLEPDTEYYLRVQGSRSDGRLYQSELLSFRTPDTGPLERPGENVAAGADVIAVSSEFSEAFAATDAVDGDPATEWSTAGDGDDAWITIDLGEPVDVVGIGFHSREMGDGSSIINAFAVTVDDGETLGPYPVGPGLAIVDVTFSGQILRFDAVDTTGGNTGAWRSRSTDSTRERDPSHQPMIPGPSRFAVGWLRDAGLPRPRKPLPCAAARRRGCRPVGCTASAGIGRCGTTWP